ncbi:6768_t:CDS:1, partial [Dentiscutata erythropus]
VYPLCKLGRPKNPVPQKATPVINNQQPEILIDFEQDLYEDEPM